MSGFQYEIQDRNGIKRAVITGYEGTARELFVPETIDGLPVTEIGRFALADREDVEAIHLPSGVRTLQLFAFQNCTRLKSITLYNTTNDYYNGVIRGCRLLREITVHCIVPANYIIIREMLSDTDAALTFHLLMEEPVSETAGPNDQKKDAAESEAEGGAETAAAVPEGTENSLNSTCSVNTRPYRSIEERDETEAVNNSQLLTETGNNGDNNSTDEYRGSGDGGRDDDKESGRRVDLTFPEYVSETNEDTMARAIHISIEGAGMAYRECVQKHAIDYAGYDRLLPRLTEYDFDAARRICLGRLMYPEQLSGEAQQRYEDYLTSHAPKVLEQVAGDHDTETVEFLANRQLIPEESISAALQAASAAGDTQICGILMDYQHRQFGSAGQASLKLSW